MATPAPATQQTFVNHPNTEAWNKEIDEIVKGHSGTIGSDGSITVQPNFTSLVKSEKTKLRERIQVIFDYAKACANERALRINDFVAEERLVSRIKTPEVKKAATEALSNVQKSTIPKFQKEQQIFADFKKKVDPLLNALKEAPAPTPQPKRLSFCEQLTSLFRDLGKEHDS